MSLYKGTQLIASGNSGSGGGGITPEEKEEIQAEIDSKASIDDFEGVQVVIDTYVNGNSGYRIWSDGYCEQWGYSTGTVAFLKEFADTCYNLTSMTKQYNYDTTYNVKSTNGFTVQQYDKVYAFDWRACGYLKEGEY